MKPETADTPTKPEAVNYVVVSCCACNKVMSDDRQWFDGTDLLAVVPKHLVSHSICPECFAAHYPEMHARFSKQGKIQAG